MTRRTTPIRLLTAGRAFRDGAEGRQYANMFHHIQGICVGSDADRMQLMATVNSLLQSVLRTSDIRWQQVPSETFEYAYRIAAGNEHGLSSVGAAGLLPPHLLRAAGIDPQVQQGFTFGFGIERLAMLALGIQDMREFWGPKYCPVEDNFDDFDPKQILAAEGYDTGDAVRTPISGVIPGGGQITPGRTWMTPDGVLHIRNQTITNNRVEGGWVGTESIDLNLDLNRETGTGAVRNRTTIKAVLSDRGASGTLSGIFSGQICGGGVSGRCVFHGRGKLGGLKVVVQASTPDLNNEAFQYEGVIIEPSRR